MKKVIFLFIIFLSTSACRSDEGIDNSMLIGNWTWISTTGGLSGQVNETPENTGKTIVLNFISDKNYNITNNGTVTSTGTYSIYKATSIITHSDKLFVGLSEDTPKIITINDDVHLILSDDANDGLIYTYRKK